MKPAQSNDRSNATTELYQQVILDHNRSPRNWGSVVDETHRADGYNPLCGDRFTVTLKVGADGQIQDIAVDGTGCAISKASASMMSETVKGRSVEEALALFTQFRTLVTGDATAPAAKELGKLKVFDGIAEFPARVKCATLSWHALESALAGHAVASTE
jgi:nitrogen fixation NifU-like protein